MFVGTIRRITPVYTTTASLNPLHLLKEKRPLNTVLSFQGGKNQDAGGEVVIALCDRRHSWIFSQSAVNDKKRT